MKPKQTKKMRPSTDHLRRGVVSFYAAPAAAYSTHDIASIFDWSLEQAESYVRIWLRHGRLNAFRKGSVNLYERSQIEPLVREFCGDGPATLAAVLLDSGAARFAIDAFLLRDMLRAAAEGKYLEPIGATRPEHQWGAEPAFGTFEMGYPPPNTDAARATRPDRSDEVPTVRGRHLLEAKKRREKSSTAAEDAAR